MRIWAILPTTPSDAADYGERTSRIRLFMVFAKKGLPVRWPRATHSKNGKTVGTLPWLPVRPCLDLEVKGRSIFDRVRINKKGVAVPDPLVEKTLKRLFAGLCHYIAGSNVPTGHQAAASACPSPAFGP